MPLPPRHLRAVPALLLVASLALLPWLLVADAHAAAPERDSGELAGLGSVDVAAALPRLPVRPQIHLMDRSVPLDRWPHDGVITSVFGEYRGGRGHDGIDIDGIVGDPVRTAGPGRVVATGLLPGYRGYGFVVVVDHGSVQTLYSHLATIVVDPDRFIPPGAVVGTVGMTGWTTGSHLHFEVRQAGAPVDPMAWLPAR